MSHNFNVNFILLLLEIKFKMTKFMKKTLRVKGSTNTCLLYMETGRFPLFIFINMCTVKFGLKILKSCDTKLISAAYDEMMRNPEKYAWMTLIKDLLCSHGFWEHLKRSICGEWKTISCKF